MWLKCRQLMAAGKGTFIDRSALIKDGEIDRRLKFSMRTQWIRMASTREAWGRLPGLNIINTIPPKGSANERYTFLVRKI